MTHWLKFILLLVSISPLSALAEEEPIKVAIGNIYKDQDQTAKYSIQVEDDLQAIYSGAGLKAEFTYLPNERAIQSVISGQYDALDMRVETLEKEKQLLKIDVPLVSFDIYLYSIDGARYNSLDDLKDQTVVSFHGTRYTKLLKHYKHLYLVHNAKQAALMLTQGRVSVWLAPEVSYLFLKQQFPDIKVASPRIARGELYHYLHVSKAHLLDKLESSAKNYIQSKQTQNQ